MSTSTLFAPCIADATARMTAMATAATAALTDTQDALAAPSLATAWPGMRRTAEPGVLEVALVYFGFKALCVTWNNRVRLFS